MTRAEFIARQRRMKRVGSIISWIWFVALFAFLFGNVVLTRYVERGTPPRHFPHWYILVFLGILAANLVAILAFVRIAPRRFDLLCPRCAHTLMGSAAQVAIATGHCGYCGAAIFSA